MELCVERVDPDFFDSRLELCSLLGRCNAVTFIDESDRSCRAKASVRPLIQDFSILEDSFSASETEFASLSISGDFRE